MALSIWIGDIDPWTVIHDNSMGSALHRAKQMVCQVRYVHSLMHNKVVPYARVRVDESQSTADGTVLLHTQRRVIALDIYGLFMVQQFKGSPPSTKVSA